MAVNTLWCIRRRSKIIKYFISSIFISCFFRLGNERSNLRVLVEDLRDLWSSSIFHNAKTVITDDYFRTLHHDWHPQKRENRFPSSYERIGIYSGGKETGWNQTCSCTPTPKDGVTNDLITKYARGYKSNGRYVLGVKDFHHLMTIRNELFSKGPRTNWYLDDSMEIIDVMEEIKMDLSAAESNMEIPVLAVIGDFQDDGLDINVPFFKKYYDFKHSYGVSNQKCEDFQLGEHVEADSGKAIIWPLNSIRHFDGLAEIPVMDTEWENKKNMAVYRGATNGPKQFFVRNEADCMKFHRCQIIQLYAPNSPGHSELIDVACSDINGHVKGYANQKGWKTDKKSIKEMLEYKAIVVLEGNDVATGLKWMMYSKSVVIMPHPTLTSWAMETLLEPWVHFIPLDEDLSNLKEMMQWVIENDKEAQKIAERSTLFIHDLFFHMDSASDHADVIHGLVEIYLSCFGINPHQKTDALEMKEKAASK